MVRSHQKKTVVVVLATVALVLVIAAMTWLRRGPRDRTTPFDLTQLKAVLAARRELDQTLWRPEQIALVHENTFARLWDQLRANPDTLEVIRDFAFESIQLGRAIRTEVDQNGIVTYTLNGDTESLSADAFCSRLEGWDNSGYRLVQSEWHHESFRQDARGRYVSVLEISLHIASKSGHERLQITGPLHVTWSGRMNDGFPVPAEMDARDLTTTARTGPAAFEPTFTVRLEAVQSEATHNDVLAADLDEDGLVDLAYPRANLWLRSDGKGAFVRQALCQSVLPGICEALFVDFNSDKRLDLLCAAINSEGAGRDIFLYEADEERRFSRPPRQLTDSSLGLLSPDSFTVGDIDLDGDLDVYVTQYHAPYRDGKMPSPYYDANDGLPSYLLQNDGGGRLHDVTQQRGLDAKRYRRTYRSSLVDLDEDGDLDLLTTSDFSGVDAYENNGQGFFSDATATWFSERTLFGMSHVFADFNNDARLDIYATGMASTTARRLESLGLARPDFPDNRHWRAKLAHGNRLFFAQPGPKFLESQRSADVARAGWSWGCAALDVENDGDVDLYVANGHLSGQSAADYCTRFWCHDIYEGHAENSGFLDLVKRNSMQLGTTVSWNGYEKNRLYLNRGTSGFTSAAFLMDVAIEQDSRSVLAEDLNGDGQIDLLVGYADRTSQPPAYVLTGLLNQWKPSGHWVGVHLHGVPGPKVMGAQVRVHTRRGIKIDTVTTGESFAAQPSTTVHFGLGETDEIQLIEVAWVGAPVTRLTNPAIDQYHTIGVD